MNRVWADRFRGVVAGFVLAVLLIGVPLFLVAWVGWPFPSRLLHMSEVRDALTRTGISDGTVVKFVAVVVWFAWTQLAVGVVAEALSVVRKRPVRMMLVLPSMRRGAGALVGALVVLYTSVGSVRVTNASRLATVLPARPASAAVASAGSTAPITAAGPTWTVRRRDTLWGIAEAALGRGERWREIQRLNADRSVAPGVVFAADQELIRPGWVLALPGDAAVPPTVDVVTYRVEKGDTLSTIAARHFGDATKWRVIWEANRGSRFGARVFDDPNLILVGWDLVLPVVPASSDAHVIAAADPPDQPSPATGAVADPTSTPAVSPSTVPPPPPSTDVPATITASASVSSSSLPPPTTIPLLTSAPSVPDVEPPSLPPAGATPGWVLPAGVSGSVLLATGAAGLLASRRRRRIERMGPHQTLPLPDPDLAPTDAAVRLGADAIGMARLDLALRALSGALSPGAARPVAVRRNVGGDLTVHFTDGRPDPPSGWQITGTDALVLPAAVPIDALAARAAGLCAPCPALVLLGCTDDSEVYLDIEAVGAVVVDGPTVVAQALARGVVATLAVSPIVDDLAVIAVGVDCYGFANERRVTSTTAFADAARLALESTAPIRRQLEAGAASTFALRQRHPEEPWEPVVVVALRDRTVQPDDVVALCGPGGRGIGVVTDVTGASVLHLAADADGRWHLEPFGWVVAPAGVAAQELADLGALLADALAAPIDLAAALDPTDAPSTATAPEWTLLVRLLGPVDVVDGAGHAAPFSRSKSLELVVWLAEHRANPSRRAARAALWAADVRDATFANVVSEARRALAALAPGGEEWIGRTGGDRLLLHPGVSTDAELLAAAVARARHLDGVEAVDALRDGLALVRDIPFSGTDYLWPDGEALPSNLVVLVTTAAAEMATRCLALDDAAGAFWATSQGLKVLPAHDELVCLRMEAHAATGNAAGVRLEFEAYERALAADPWGDAEPSSKVLATRARLLRPTSSR